MSFKKQILDLLFGLTKWDEDTSVRMAQSIYV